MGIPEFIVGWAEVWVAWGLHLQLASEMGQSRWDQDLISWGLYSFQVATLRIELNFNVLSWWLDIWRTGGCMEQNNHYLIIFAI